MLVREPHRQGAQAAQREIDVVGPDAQADRCRRCRSASASVVALADTVPNMMSEWPPIYLVPAWIERSTPLLEGAEIERRRPGIVHQHDRALGMGGGGDRRDVLHLEGLRARRLDEHRAGVRLDQLRDAGADQRIVIGGLDADSA